MENRDREQVFDAFRRWGYLQADLDPFGRLKPVRIEELDSGGEFAEGARAIYCGSIGAEFMHIPDPERRAWIQERLEGERPAVDQTGILRLLTNADVLEKALAAAYPGTKRFSIEGIESLIPLLDAVLEASVGSGAEEAVMGMSHRGRLNVMVQIVGTTPEDLFAGFEDVDPRSVLGGGDVKYHVGATGTHTTIGGAKISVRLVSNPSHLEAVDPVVMGRVRAKQARTGRDGIKKILPIIIHGDAAFAGQGMAAEALNFAGLPGFSIGGTIHIIANNLLGFTAVPNELHSSRFASDVARRLPVPIFHVNADDPDAAARIGRLAADYRYRFSSGVVIDLIGFRRHGHSEIDDPTITQPLLYEKINAHPPLWKLYMEATGLDASAMEESARREYGDAREKASKLDKAPRLVTLPDYWAPFVGGCYTPAYDDVTTAIPPADLKEIAEALVTVPAQFNVHPRVKRFLDQRSKMGRGEMPIDFGFGELVAFGSLLRQGIPVRLSGQDSRRGTFSQRHAVLIDTANEQEYVALSHLAPGQASFDIFNTALSEAAALGFEYGYSRDFPEALVLWEAQFGDFANGGQVIIDQFIAAAEDKWDLLSGVVLLLPHGYEGQGPEHSSARLERFLQLTGEDNIQVCQPSTAAQYFHLLRRQALRKWRKPLIVMTPKSMLRLADASSPIGEFSEGRFREVLPDEEALDADRLILCTGKIGRELRLERKRRGDMSTAIVFLEQLAPFPRAALAAAVERYARAKEILWVQEEPANMGAYSFVMPRLHQIAGTRPVRSVKRSASAATATGSVKAHQLEQQTLIAMALGG